MPWEKVCTLSKLERQKRLLHRSGDHELLVLWHQQQAFALDNQCPHQGFPLEEGQLDPEQQSIRCPLHGWCFSLADGKGINSNVELPCYPTKIEGNEVWLRIEND